MYHDIKTLSNYFRFGKKYFDLAAKLLAKHALHKIAGKTYKIISIKSIYVSEYDVQNF